MKRHHGPARRIATLGLLFAVVATGVVIVLSLAPLWQALGGRIPRAQPRVRVSASSETFELPAVGIERIVVDTDLGRIDLRAEEDLTAIRYWAERHATGYRDDVATSVAQDWRPVARRDKGLLRLVTEQDSRATGRAANTVVDWHVRVPVGMAVSMNTLHGEIGLRGPVGATVITSPTGAVVAAGGRGDLEIGGGFGDVRVNDWTGALSITTSTGAIQLVGAVAEGRVLRLQSEFGAVDVHSASGGSIDIRSGSGRLDLQRLVASDRIDLSSGFGDVEARDLRARRLELSTRGGGQLVDGLTVSEALTLTTRFGDIDLSGIRSPRSTVRSDSGSLTLRGRLGVLRAETGSGDLIVVGGEGPADGLSPDLRSQSGDIRFTGRIDPGPPSPLRIESEFGDVEVRLPTDLALEVELASRFGDVRSDLALEDRRNDEGVLRGRIAGGGRLLGLRSTSGDIDLRPLE